ncbi:MAG: hypothetical protein WD894_09895 [Pirellulales bacterium]
MARPQYRDNYEGGGKYAKQNDAMLDQEQLRLTAWQKESTVYKPTLIPIVSLIAVLALAIAGMAAIYYLAAGSTAIN